MIDSLLDTVAEAGLWVLLAAAFGFAFAETALFLDFIVPGEVGLVVVGAAAERADAPLPLLIAVASAGAIAGDSVSYLLGRHFGLRLVNRWDYVREHVGPSLARAHRYFADRGGAAVFFGRFVGALRAVVPFVAGMSRMPYPRFLFWNVLASIAWTGTVVSLGFFVGRRISDDVDRVALVVSVTVVVALVIWWLVRRRRAATVAEAAGGAAERELDGE